MMGGVMRVNRFPGKKRREGEWIIIIFYCDDVRGVKIMRIINNIIAIAYTALHTLCFVSRY